MSLLIMDLDHFKKLNDQHGHAAGDAALRAFADTVCTVLHDDRDLFCRLGGEEFAVVMPATSSANAKRTVEMIRAASYPVTVSIGVSTDRTSTMISDLLAVADGALYIAKHTTRD